MTTQKKLNSSLFPDYPRGGNVVTPDGQFTPTWHSTFGSVFQALQSNFKNEGFVFPPLNATEISNIQAIYTPLVGSPLPQNVPDISGQTIFDTTNRVLKVFIIEYASGLGSNISAATWQTISSS